jgi:hyperosmotically inducible periplasmic protein
MGWLTSGPRLGLTVALLLGTGVSCTTVDRWTDARIEAEIKARLVAEKEANLTRLGVLSSKGTVYLNGTVASPDQKARAEALAHDVVGVRRVVNGLQVGSE